MLMSPSAHQDAKKERIPQEALCAVIGELSGADLERLWEQSGCNVNTAINLWFEGRFVAASLPATETLEVETETNVYVKAADETELEWPKYIGECLVAAVALISGPGKVNPGDKVTLERSSKMEFLSSSSKKRKIARKNITVRVNKVLPSGFPMEIGRLDNKTSEFVSLLMDLQMLHMEGVVAFVTDPDLKLLSEIYLQVNVSLYEAAFRHIAMPLSASATATASEETEQTEDVRARKAAVEYLMHQVDLKPLSLASTNPFTPSAGPETSSTSTEPSQDAAEATVTKEEIDIIYAGNSHPTLPEATPAPGFQLVLHPYQVKRS